MREKSRGWFKVDYDDGNQETYKAFVLEVGRKKIRFATGDPIIDWIDYLKYIGDNSDKIFSVGHSSGIDHWFMDGEKWTSIYCDHSDEKNIKSYSRTQINTDPLLLHKSDDFQEYVVTPKIKTFGQLKKYYHAKKELAK